MLVRKLQDSIKHGTLHLRMPDGQEYRFGQGAPVAQWNIHSRQAVLRIISDPELELGETYMAGDWDAGDAGLEALLEILMRNIPHTVTRNSFRRVLELPLSLLRQLNRIRRSYRNVAAHYDIDEWLFRHFLDEDMQYSCAYFARPDMTLEEAQRAKCRHIMGKLNLKPGDRVLDIGCGWGGLALYLAEQADVFVTGLTLSKEQLRVARERARQRGMEGRVQYLFKDYREHDGDYDAIVSVGMFEHVGRPNFVTYFSKIRDMLRDHGVAMVHTIGVHGHPSPTNPWIQRHIFPGGYIPALSELGHSIASSGMINSDVEVLRLHYADTLASWLVRFRKHGSKVLERYGERFYRMWEFYLATCEASFRWRDLVVYQVQLAHRLDAVPITRDYLYDMSSPAKAMDRALGRAGHISQKAS